MATNRDTFDRIAESWYRVRHWPLLREELELLAQRWSGGRLLNIGCAHGADFLPFRQCSESHEPDSSPKMPKHAQEDSSQSELRETDFSRKTPEEALGHSAKFELWGMDFAPRMLEQAQRYSAKFGFQVNLVVADMLALPYGDSTFDFAIAVAAYHHIQGSNHRATAVKELARVLKPGGEAFLSVWNRAQPRFWLRSREQLVPWRLGGKTVHRYYHLFTYGEIRRLLAGNGFDIIYLGPEKSYQFPLRSFSRNICALVRKQSGVEPVAST